MSGPNNIERRDPCAPVLKLGTLLTQVRRQHVNGAISLESGQNTHRIVIAKGAIAEVVGPKGDISRQKATAVFSLQRPVVTFSQHMIAPSRRELLDPVHLLIQGMTARQDLFAPVAFNERVPVNSLRIDDHQLWALRKLPFTADELAFFKRLNHDTPVPMILWKRGLPPAHAASLLTTLNLLGVWQEQWQPGFLPRAHVAHRVVKQVEKGADDFQLLGIPVSADAAEVDRAFRQLSFELHPDRNQRQPAETQQKCQEAFAAVSSAYQRLKHSRSSRRQRPVVHRAPDTTLWQRALTAAETALSQGNVPLARKHAINGLLLNPPEFARTRFTELLRAAA
ncbi:MAG: J domain-containing protein [Deltaproteobacteria bacterium]|nr:J domain-containing protein [Deltaproteobacteria bacterium]